VQDVLVRAGLSHAVFDEHFEGKEDCFLAAFDVAALRLRTQVEAAAGRGGADWRGRLRMGLEELLQFVVAEPDASRTLFVEARAACTAALLRRDELLDSFAAWIDSEARAELSNPPSGIAGARTAGTIDAFLYGRIVREETSDFEEVAQPLMQFAILPYSAAKAAS
jgi:AcrR family transcriptional regulator